MFVTIAWLYPCGGGYSAANWNIGLRSGAQVSMVDNSGTGTIPAAARSIGLATTAVAGTMVELLSTRAIRRR